MQTVEFNSILSALDNYSIKPQDAPEPPRMNAAPTGGDYPERLNRASNYIAGIPGVSEGGRNAAAYSLTARLRDKFDLMMNDALDLIGGWNNRNNPPLDDHELTLAVNNAYQYAKNPAGAGYEPRPTIKINKANSSPVAKTSYPLTDLGNAERFADQHGDTLRYCMEAGKWYFYDGIRWNGFIGTEKAHQAAIRTVRDIAKEADGAVSKSDREKVYAWSLSSESQHRINAMLSLAQKLAPIVCHASDFDRDDYSLNCLNGTIDLKTGMLRSHDPDDLITKLCPVAYDANAVSEVWDRYLDSSTEGDQTFMDFLQVAVGYTLTGDTKEEKMFFIYGPTASGKSTFLESLKSILGDYALTADFETFIKRGQVGGARNDVARMAGTRFVISIEVDEGKELAEGLVKMMTGGDTLSARFLYKESFEFVPRCKLWLAANHAPKVSDRDDAIWRRILRVPFIHTVPEDKRDPAVKATLRNPAISGPAILAWAVQGCIRWQSEGLIVPELVKASTEAYRTENDPLKDFFETECTFDSRLHCTVSGMRQRYDAWAKNNGLRYTLGPQQFNSRLTDKGCTQKTRDVANDLGTLRPQRCWIGVGLTEERPC